ncbi:MAG: hypothetical protein RL095_360 [Verrucomicrobiota bacterium]
MFQTEIEQAAMQMLGDLVTRNLHHQNVLMEEELVADRHQGAAAPHGLQMPGMGA